MLSPLLYFSWDVIKSITWGKSLQIGEAIVDIDRNIHGVIKKIVEKEVKRKRNQDWEIF